MDKWYGVLAAFYITFVLAGILHLNYIKFILIILINRQSKSCMLVNKFFFCESLEIKRLFNIRLFLWVACVVL